MWGERLQEPSKLCVSTTYSLSGISNVSYSIRLSTQFHAEHLLDRDHYLDWLVSSLANSQQAKLPMWLLITQIYWKDILLSRKFGRRLSAALLNHWAEVCCPLLLVTTLC